MTDVDPIGAVRTLLLADAAVIALVGGRVFGGELPPDESKHVTERCSIVLTPAGGGLLGRAYQDYGDTRVDVTCYGPDLNETWNVYLAAKTVLRQLQRKKVGNVLLHSATESSRGSLACDPVKQWPTCYSSWQVLAAFIAAA